MCASGRGGPIWLESRHLMDMRDVAGVCLQPSVSRASSLYRSRRPRAARLRIG
jgi:hypothetical protein